MINRNGIFARVCRFRAAIITLYSTFSGYQPRYLGKRPQPASGKRKRSSLKAGLLLLYYIFFVLRLASPSMILALAQGIRANQVPATSPSG